MRTTAGSALPAASATRLAAAGLVMIAVCYGLARFAYGLFVPAFGAEFGLDAGTAGAIASSSYAAYCVAIVAATVGTARWGPPAGYSRSPRSLNGSVSPKGRCATGDTSTKGRRR